MQPTTIRSCLCWSEYLKNPCVSSRIPSRPFPPSNFMQVEVEFVNGISSFLGSISFLMSVNCEKYGDL